VGRDEPLRLDLEGDALQDLAGRLLTFRNPSPGAGESVHLDAEQSGTVGDLTASRKVRVPELSLDQIREYAAANREIPTRMASGVYLEWFSRANGRVVVESTAYQVQVSAPVWDMSAQESEARAEANREAFGRYLDRDTAPAGPDDDEEEPSDDAMDEFAWEAFMKERDARTDRYTEVLEKYEGHPDQERLVAREMGWTWIEDMLDAQERGLTPDDSDADEEDYPELVPNPLTEGVDWVRDESGHPTHPLTLRTMKLSVAMWRQCDALGHTEPEGAPELHDMVFHTQMTSAKLAGALNGLAFHDEPDGGFIVAYLKRALNYLHQALSASDRVTEKRLLPEADLTQYRADLFAIREEILRLMQRFRETE
jgi:hypothetical protein